MLDIDQSITSQPRSPCSAPRKPARLVAPDDDANNGDFLPADELQEVFLRLPSKPLGRLRTVCRSWRSMLSDPLFVTAHASRSRADSIFVVAVHYPGHDRVDVKLVDVSTGAVLRCMDGLVRRRLCVGGELLCFLGPRPGDGAVEVLDPATGTTTDVLLSGDSTAPENHTDWTASVYLVGHVPATGEHKVLHITDVKGKQACEVFTIGAAGRNSSHQCQRWRPAQSPPMRVEPTIPQRRAVVNGVAYFLPSHLNGRYLPDCDNVAAFDLEKEEWMPTPIRGPLSSERPGHRDQLLHFSLAELNGRLVMVHHNYQRKTIDMYSLSLTEGVEWWRALSLHLDSVLDRTRKGETVAQPLMELDDGRIVLFVPGTDRRVVRVYDPIKETRTDVMEMPMGRIIAGFYKGSILPFRGVGEAGCVCG